MFGLYVVDPTDQLKAPANAPKPFGSASSSGEKLRIGDYVRLASNVADECLGSSASACQFGVVVKASRSDNQVTVFCVNNAEVASYETSDLAYADGSVPGVAAPQPIAIGAGKRTTRFVPGSVVFKKGDRVVIGKDASDFGGCLGKFGSGLVGIVENDSDQSSIRVKCNDPKCSSLLSSGSYPNWRYSNTDLVPESKASTGKVASQLPLIAGDRVVISSSFTDNGAEGWCLGSPTQTPESRIEGVVLMALEPSSLSRDFEQRNVLVCAVDDGSADSVYAFRSSWLERKPTQRPPLKLGDRVQCDASICSGNEPVVNGKCLGSPSSAVYGRVVSVGYSRDGVQPRDEQHFF